MLSRSLRNGYSLAKVNRLTSRSLGIFDGIRSDKETNQDKALRKDVKTLGKILGSAIKSESEDVFESVERLRALGREVFKMISIQFKSYYG